MWWVDVTSSRIDDEDTKGTVYVIVLEALEV